MIIVDTREKQNGHILAYFKANSIEYKQEALKYCDYASETQNKIRIERKKDLTEFSNNCGKQHARFKAELERAKADNCKTVILIEQPLSFFGFLTWKNGRGLLNGDSIYKIVLGWADNYNIDVVFCDKSESGKIINKILRGLYTE